MQLTSSWILVGFVTTEPQQNVRELPHLAYFNSSWSQRPIVQFILFFGCGVQQLDVGSQFPGVEPRLQG